MINESTFTQICEKAHTAGMESVKNTVSRTVMVYEETHPFSGTMDNTKPHYILDDYPCGFSWVNVYPANKGNTSLGKEERRVLESAGFRKNDYEKSYQLWVSDFNQSMQKKEAYADAFAKVLRENGIRAYSGSRMD
jgi:hypothetical protein